MFQVYWLCNYAQCDSPLFKFTLSLLYDCINYNPYRNLFNYFLSCGRYELLLVFECAGMYEFCRVVLLYAIATYQALYGYGSLCYVTSCPCFLFSYVKILPLFSKLLFFLFFFVITLHNIPIFHCNCHSESWHFLSHVCQWRSKLQIPALVIACLWRNKESSGAYITNKYKWTEYCNIRMYKIYLLFGILHSAKALCYNYKLHSGLIS